MEIDKDKFCECLALYGSDVKTWPEKVRVLGLSAQHHPEYMALIEKEKRFELLLLEDSVLPAPADLITRVLVASRPNRMNREPSRRFSPEQAYVKPAAFAAMLVVGFIIGFNTFSPAQKTVEESFMQSFSDEEEKTL